jgi:hypothetical protein
LPAYLLPGIESGIRSELCEAANDTSTTHIIAISGFKLLPIDVLQINNIGFIDSREPNRPRR